MASVPPTAHSAGGEGGRKEVGAGGPEGGSVESLEAFVRTHGTLLLSAGVPASLHAPLFRKLTHNTFDAGDWFQVEAVNGGRQRHVVLTRDGGLEKEADVFLVDHAWSFRLRDARKQLDSIPGLAHRMAALMCVDDTALLAEESGESEGEAEQGGEEEAEGVADEKIGAETEGLKGTEREGGSKGGAVIEGGEEVTQGGGLEAAREAVANTLGELRVEDGDGNGDGGGDGGQDGQKQQQQHSQQQQQHEAAAPAWLELDEMGLSDKDVASLQLPSKLPNLVALSLWGNCIEDIATVTSVLAPLAMSLRALWLNGNPCCCDDSGTATGAAGAKSATQQHTEQAVLKAFPRLEIFNSRLTPRYTAWALLFCAGVYGPHSPGLTGPSASSIGAQKSEAEESDEVKLLSQLTELDLSNRGMQALKPELFGPKEANGTAAPWKLQSLDLRGNPLLEQLREDLFALLRQWSNLTSIQVDVPGPLGGSPSDVLHGLQQLRSVNGVEAAKITVPGVNPGKRDEQQLKSLPVLTKVDKSEALTERVLRAKWQYVNSYRLATEEQLDESSVWYVMDEFGSAIRHSDDPNFVAAPFLFMPNGRMDDAAVSYTVVWPTRRVESGEECTRDFLPGAKGRQQRLARLSVWFHVPTEAFDLAYKQREAMLDTRSANPLPASTKAMQTAAAASSTPCDTVADALAHSPKPPSSTVAMPLKVFTDMPQVRENLKRPEFAFVDEPSEADVVWTSVQVDDEFCKLAGIEPMVAPKQLKQTSEQPRQTQEGAGGGGGAKAALRRPLINQFPYEACIVMKHHLAKTMQQAYGRRPWLPDTFDLECEMEALIGCNRFLQKQQQQQQSETAGEKREKEALFWILKPWNMARSIDSAVVENILQAIRMAETGPKICQRYIARPALYKGRKFDLRVFVLLKRLAPLDAYVSDVFWARIANHAYSLDPTTTADFETHFTVMNYIGGSLTHVPTHDFVHDFEQEHNVRWADIDARIRTMLRELLLGAAAAHPEMDGSGDGGAHEGSGGQSNSGGGRFRALYGVDVMLDDQFEPKLLEVTYCPDCSRACKYDMRAVMPTMTAPMASLTLSASVNDDISTVEEQKVEKNGGEGEGRWIRASTFFNDVFGCLFLNEESNVRRL